MTRASVSGVVLAGGTSRRFGSDKRRALADGKVLLGGACEKISAAVGNPERQGISISATENEATFRSDVLVPALRETVVTPSEFRIVPDQYPDCGPLGGILSSLFSFDSDWLLVLAVDLPAVSVDTLRRMIEYTQERNNSDVSAVVAEGAGGGLHPLIGCYNQRLRPYIESALSDDNLGVQQLLNAIDLRPEAGRIARLRVRENELHNINFPRDISTDAALL